MFHFPVSHPPSLCLSLSGWSRPVGPPTFSSFFFFLPLLCSSLSAVLSSLCVSRWPNRQICSFSTGLWISHNRPQILSPDSVLPGWEAKQREEGGEEMKAFCRVVQGRGATSKSFCNVCTWTHVFHFSVCVCAGRVVCFY